MRRLMTFAVLALAAGSAAAQLPGLRKRQPVPPAPVLVGIDALRADFLAQTGSATVYFGGDASVLTPAARATLTAQAAWLRLHPEVAVRIEGHADPSDTRDHALAVGARRAGTAIRGCSAPSRAPRRPGRWSAAVRRSRRA